MNRVLLMRMLAVVVLVFVLGQSHEAAAQDSEKWHGYEILDSVLNGSSYKVVFPDKPNENRDWIWRARFWGHEPQTDIALLEQGFHVDYIDVGGLFGNEEAIDLWDTFYEKMISEYQLNPKVVMEGLSRGGLIVYNWANRNADKLAVLKLEAESISTNDGRRMHDHAVTQQHFGVQDCVRVNRDIIAN